MMEISNRTIAMLLVATLAVYLGGTFISLNRLGRMGYVSSGLVTAPPASGKVTLRIATQTAIAWQSSTIGLGSEAVRGGFLMKTAPVAFRSHYLTGARSDTATLNSRAGLNVGNS